MSIKLILAVCTGELESVALNVRGVAFTAVVGVPLINPLDEFTVKPVGKVPEASVHK